MPDETFTRILVRIQSLLNGRNRPILIFTVRGAAPIEFRCHYKKKEEEKEEEKVEVDYDDVNGIVRGAFIWISGRIVEHGSRQILDVTELSFNAITSPTSNSATKRYIPVMDCFAKESVLETELLLHVMDYLPPGTCIIEYQIRFGDSHHH